MKTKGEEYITEIYKFRAHKQNTRNKLKQLRRDASKEYRTKERGWFLTLDILAILCIVMNFGALFITNALVVHAEPAKVFVEANPVQCEWNGYSCHDDARNVVMPILKQLMLWSLIIFGYIYMRNTTFNVTGLWILTLFVTIYTVMLGADFLNDLGYYLGKLVWGV